MKLLFKSFLGLVGVLTLGLVVLSVMSYFKANQIEDRYDDSVVDDVQTVSIDGHTMAYRDFGDNQNPVIVFVHGFLGSSYDYIELSEALKTDYYVIAIDLLGFGMSDKPPGGDYRNEAHATRLNLFLEALNIETFILGGHSMGGDIALRYAHLYPEQVDHLILFASAGLEERDERPLPKVFYSAIFKNYYLQYLGFRSIYHQDAFKTQAQFAPMYYFTKQIPPKTLQAFTSDQDDWSIVGIIDTIEQEVLLIHGVQDTWIRIASSEILAEGLPKNTFVKLNDVGHMPFIEDREGTLKAIEAFLE